MNITVKANNENDAKANAIKEANRQVKEMPYYNGYEMEITSMISHGETGVYDFTFKRIEESEPFIMIPVYSDFKNEDGFYDILGERKEYL
jgi:hypothetical protein